MVKAIVLEMTDGARWAFYLALSAFLMLCISNAIKIDAPTEKLITPIVLKLKLLALAAPKAGVAALPPRIMQPPSKPKNTHKIVTLNTAVKRVSVSKPIKRPIQNPLELNAKSSSVLEKRPTPKEALVKIKNPLSKPMKTAKTQKQKPPPLPLLKETTLTKAQGKNQSTIIQEAKYRKQTPPAYPSRAVELGQQGVVTLHAEVMPNGHPGELKIAQSSGYRLLDIAAINAVKNWEFEPATTQGKTYSNWVKVPVRFVIQ